ncbi:hypothetical protein L7F22_066533 [Adiantum nelumboides]|nr:hypothetical protein [Adiantum nelumboides]
MSLGQSSHGGNTCVNEVFDTPRLTMSMYVSYMCQQVCLFAVEDAPALLRLVSQDFLEARKVRMIRALSAIDMHPGSGSAATKRAKLDVAAVLVMDAQLTWSCPKRVSYDPLWLVAAGDNSSEVPAEQHREVRVLEAFYPRISAIPASPIEPPKGESEIDEATLLQIPLISCDDEGDAHSEGVRSTTKDMISSGMPARLTPQIDSDPDVAAAAAAAFAVLKAQERGSLIDRDLLIKILSNPLVTEHLKNSNINLLSGSNSVADPHIGGAVENGKERVHLNSSMTRGRGTHARPVDRGVLQWQQGSPMWQPLGSNGRSVHGRGSFEQEKGILGNGEGAYGLNSFMEQLCQDASKKLFPHSHIRCIPTNETLRQSPCFHENMAPQNLVGLNCQPFFESSLPYPKKGTGTRERIPAASAKIRKPCLFFNTPKGCRNGIHCKFVHELNNVEPSDLAGKNPSNAVEGLKITKNDNKEVKAG